MKKLALAAALASLLAGCGAPGTATMSPAARAAQFDALAKKPAVDVAKATKWVAANSGGSFWDSPRKHTFPATDDGNSGTTSRAYAGADGEWFAAFAKAWFQSYKNPPQFDFDPATDLMIAVETSDDEPVVIVAIFDRKTGKGRALGEIGVVDLSYNLPQAAFAKFFPKLGNVKDVDYAEVLKVLDTRGVTLGV